MCKITRNRVAEILKGRHLLANLEGAKFNYAVEKNMNSLTAEWEAAKKGIYTSELYKEFQKEYEEILNSEAKKDESGNIILKDDTVLLANPQSFKTRIEALKQSKKYKAEIDKKESKDKEFNEFINEQFEFEFYLIDLEQIPSNINNQQMSVIFEMIRNESK